MYCTPDELTEYVFKKYLEKIEALVPGIIDEHISGVSMEIDDALRPRFALPLSTPPETICRIAKVMASFRCVGSITTLMDTEAASANIWLPLQMQYKEALKDLKAIAAGKMDLGLEALGNEPDDGQGAIAVHKRPGIFNDAFWKRF